MTRRIGLPGWGDGNWKENGNGDSELDEELLDELAKHRVLLLTEELDSEVSNDLIASLLELSFLSPADIFLFINCPGGSVTNGLSIINTMEMIKAEVHTICIGDAISMGSLILAAGARGKRRAFPHARIMTHQPWVNRFKAKTGILAVEHNHMDTFRKDVTEIYKDKTGLSSYDVQKLLQKDCYMTPQTAKKNQLIDDIGAPVELDEVFAERG
uniref:ATP-dependent Clp protease proteolytic subunit n=1 Tax=Linum pallescens TaxID=586388 RepID=UPI00220EC74F|nr:ATP-dependent Clp protease proteolytic subunit [Linum pallescens]UXN84046.1 ATP-dependent Clp protease proteolytic subunit [Linum pallescens]